MRRTRLNCAPTLSRLTPSLYLISISSLFSFLPLDTALFGLPAEGKRTGYKLKVNEQKRVENSTVVSISEEEADSIKIEPGCFLVSAEERHGDSWNITPVGYSLKQILFTGFDKNQNNSKESFFIINNTDRELAAVSLYIDYRTPDGRQLTRRFLRIACSIPAGQTRSISIPTWDTQRSFYYYQSRKSGKGGNPFDITFTPISYLLRQ